jgi:hypothetical protein
MALATLENVLRKYIITFLTLAITISQFPSFICTSMILYQVGSLFFEANLAHSHVHMVVIVISVNDDIGPSYKTISVPLWARTSLPRVTTKVAELGSAELSSDANQ